MENQSERCRDVGPLSKWERRGLLALLAASVAFGLLVEVRSALLEQRIGDVGVYLRAGWAVRSGEDIYDITDRGRWHYCYPSLLAILMTPLAEPPEGIHAAGTVPYPVAVGVWYVLNLIFLCLAVHWLACALERSGAVACLVGQRPGNRAWWGLRVQPVLACLPSLGHTLMRGQTNLLVLALMAGMAAAVLESRRIRAGVWLAGAICIKMIPAFLLLYPLWRRQGRTLAGCAAGLVIGLFAVPAAVFGPAEAVAQCRKLNAVMILPALGLGNDRSRADELINVTATDSQSLLAILHNTLHFERTTRPDQATAAVRLTAELLGGLLALLTLLAAGRRPLDAIATLAFLGALVLNLLFLSPVCHLHYYCLALPLVMALVAADWRRAGKPVLTWKTAWLLTAFALAQVPPHIPGLELLRDGGLMLYAGLALWLAGVHLLWRARSSQPAALSADAPCLNAAA